MTLTDEQLLILEDAANKADMEFWRSYSGRGMYGDTCVGIVGDSGGLIRFVFALARDKRDGADEIIEELEYPSTDNVAYDKIWYWPTLTTEE